MMSRIECDITGHLCVFSPAHCLVVRLSEPRSPSTPRHYPIKQQMAVTACHLNALYGETKRKSRFASCDIVPRAILFPYSSNTESPCFTAITILFALWKLQVVQGVSLLRRTDSLRLIHFGEWLKSVIGIVFPHHCFPPAESNWQQTVMQNRQFNRSLQVRRTTQSASLISLCSIQSSGTNPYLPLALLTFLKVSIYKQSSKVKGQLAS